MLNFFKRAPKENFLTTDIHSHLLPEIDDGVKSMDESIEILRTLQNLGFEKVVTTPHIMHGYYENTNEIIRSKLEQLRLNIQRTEGLDIMVYAAAEYYVDEHFLQSVEDGEELLCFGNNYVLIETSFLNKPILLFDLIFLLQSKGYNPVLAHPERYVYIQENTNIIQEVVDTNTLLQINVGSFEGYYSVAARKLAERMVRNNQVSFLGSDIHNQKHLNVYKKAISKKYFQQCRQLDLLNNSL